MLKKKGLFIWSLLCIVSSFYNPSYSQSAKKLKTIVVDAGHGGQDAGATGQYENSMRSKEKDVALAISKKVVVELKKQLPELNIIPTRTTDIYQPVNEKARLANEFKGDLFLCIHADSGPLKTGRRQIGTRTVTKYKVTYTGKGKRKKKKSTPYQVIEPVYEYFKLPLKASGTSVYIFAAHKTSAKLKAIMDDVGEFEIETNEGDSTYVPIDFNTPGNKTIAQIYAKRYQEKSDLLASLVNDEIDKTGRIALGVNQRQVGIAVLQATNMPAILIETGFINNPEDERYLNSNEGQQELAEAITQAVIHYKRQIENAGKVSSQ
jgi:N-acetylmuramoyl-L-alanine amidase